MADNGTLLSTMLESQKRAASVNGAAQNSNIRALFLVGAFNILDRRRFRVIHPAEHHFVGGGSAETDGALGVEAGLGRVFGGVVEFRDDIQAGAFIIGQDASGNDLEDFIVSIDDVESRTGLVFFPDLPSPGTLKTDEDGDWVIE